MTDPKVQAWIGEIRRVVLECGSPYGKAENRLLRKLAALTFLDQLSAHFAEQKQDELIRLEEKVILYAYIAEQEKAVRVKVLEEIQNELRLKIAGLEQTERNTPITFSSDYISTFKWQLCIIDQKIEEAKNS